MPWQGQGSVTHGFLSLMNGCSAELARAEESGLTLFSVAAVSARAVTEGYKRAMPRPEEKRMGKGAGISPSAWFPRA